MEVSIGSAPSSRSREKQPTPTSCLRSNNGAVSAVNLRQGFPRPLLRGAVTDRFHLIVKVFHFCPPPPLANSGKPLSTNDLVFGE